MISFGWVMLISCLLILSVSIAIWIFIRIFLVVITIGGYSMTPTFEDGEQVLLLRHWPTRWLRRGLIVVVQPYNKLEDRLSPLSEIDFIPCIKRIVGLPGDVIATTVAKTQSITSTRMYIKEYIGEDWGDNKELARKVPPGYLFVQGDNPARSIDSSVWGPLPYRNVLGVVVMRLDSKSQE